MEFGYAIILWKAKIGFYQEKDIHGFTHLCQGTWFMTNFKFYDLFIVSKYNKKKYILFIKESSVREIRANFSYFNQYIYIYTNVIII